MTIVFEFSYCNVYGTGYQLRYVYRKHDPGIAVEYITGTSNLLSDLRSSHSRAKNTTIIIGNIPMSPLNKIFSI
jgi:hypothetical protein